jgi:hypothetical protein
MRLIYAVVGGPLFGGALAETIKSFHDGAAGSGPIVGGVVAGFGLGLLVLAAPRKG